MKQCYTDLEENINHREKLVHEQEISNKYAVNEEQQRIKLTQDTVRKETVEKYNSEIEELKRTQEIQQNLKSELKREIQELKEKEQKLQTEIANLESEMQGLVREMNRENEEETRLKENICDIERELNDAKIAFQTETQKYEELKLTQIDLMQKLQEKTDFRKKNQFQNAEKARIALLESEKIRQNANSLKAKNDELAAELSTKEQMKSAYEREIAENLSAITVLCSELESMTKALATVKDVESDTQRQAGELMTEIAELQLEEGDLRVEVERGESELKLLGMKVEQYIKELTTQEDLAASKEQLLAVTEERVESHTHQLQSREQLLAATHLQIEQENVQLSIALEGLEKTLSELRNEEFTLKAEIEEMRNRELLGTSKLHYDSERALRSEIADVAEETLQRKHSEQMRLLEAERRRLELKADEIERLVSPRGKFGA